MISIVPAPPDADPPWDLLLLADPDPAQLARYLPDALIWLAQAGEATVGACAGLPHDASCWEIRALAVAPAWQGQGLAQRLIARAEQAARQDGYQRLRIGTGNSSTRQLRLYQYLGFALVEVVWDHFMSYDAAPIYEDGIACRHLLVLEKPLT